MSSDGREIISVSDLPITYRGAIYPWHCDHMGHMNISWYIQKFDEATWNLFADLGITPSYIRDQQRGIAAVKQETIFKRELRAGDIVTVRSGVLEIKEKTIQFIHEMINGETGGIAAFTKLTAVHIDTQVRASTPFPEEIRTRCKPRLVTYE